MTKANLTISSKNYSSWSLRGWLMCKMAGLDFEEVPVKWDDVEARQELLLLSPSVRVPRLTHRDAQIWDTLAIAEYLNEEFPGAAMLPAERKARAFCRSVSGEIHSGFYNLRSALPMNIKARYEGFRVFTGARPDIERVKQIWSQCLEQYGGPFLFGERTVADAMYAPVCTRFRTYDVELEPHLEKYCDMIFKWAPMVEWIEAAVQEPEEVSELEVEF